MPDFGKENELNPLREEMILKMAEEFDGELKTRQYMLIHKCSRNKALKLMEKDAARSDKLVFKKGRTGPGGASKIQVR